MDASWAHFCQQMKFNSCLSLLFDTEFVYKQIDELQDLGINAIRITNLFSFGSDGAVLDYTSVNRDYGSLADFLSLMELLKEKGE